MTTAEPTTQHVYFGISGEFLTEHARALVTEGKPQRGIKFLVDSLHGMSWDQAIAICKGDQHLIGWERGPEGPGIQMVEQDQNDTAFLRYQDLLKSVYAGRFTVEGKWYQPYVVLTGGWSTADVVGQYNGALGFDRLPWTSLGLRLGGADRLRDLSVRRALYYSDNPETDYVAILPYTPQAKESGKYFSRQSNHYVLCARVEAPPLWMDQHIEAEAGFRAYLLARDGRIREDGAAFRDFQVLSFDASLGLAVDHDRHRSPEVPATSEQRAERRAAREAARARAEEEEEQLYISECANYRDEIRRRCEAEDGLGYRTLNVERPDGDDRPTEYQIPRAPFDVWALCRTSARKLAPDWTPVSPSGLKMIGDNANHTDWMLGAEPPIPLDGWYGSGYTKTDAELFEAAYRLNFQVASAVAGFEAHVLCGTGQAVGMVVHPKEDEEVPEGSIIVIPRAGPEYFISAHSAAGNLPKLSAVITESGGQLAHLVAVGLEQGFRIIRVENARERFPSGTPVEIDFDAGTIITTTYGLN